MRNWCSSDQSIREKDGTMRIKLNLLKTISMKTLSIVLLSAFFAIVSATTLSAQTDGIYNIVSFGAKGDGVTDCSPAIQKTLDAIMENGGGQLFIPQGKFLMKSQVGIENTELIFLSIKGLGLGVSVIHCDNPDGAFKLHYRNNRSQITIKDISLFAMREGAGIAFDMLAARQGNTHHRCLTMENVEMRGMNIKTDYFNTGVKAYGIWRPVFYSVVFAGPFGPGVSRDLTDESMLFKADVAFDVCESYAPRFQDCYAWSAKTGYKLVTDMAPGAEDGTLLHSYAVHCRIGVDVYTKGVEPQLLIDGGHYNCRDYGIRIKGRKFVSIINCLMYNEDLVNNNEYVDIYLEGCHNVIISANIFHFKGSNKRTNVLVKKGAYEIDIKNNRFNAHANPVTVEKGTRKITVTGNGFADYVTDKLRDYTNGQVITDIEK